MPYAYPQHVLDMRTGEIIGQEKETRPKIIVENVSDGIVVTYNFTYAKIEEDTIFSNNYFVKFQGLTNLYTSSYPSLPFDKEFYVLPKGCTASVSVIDSTTVTLPLGIAPARSPRLNSYTDASASDNILPIRKSVCNRNVSAVINTKLINYKNTPLLSVMVSPVKYNASLRETTLYSSIKYKITFQRTSNISRDDNIIKKDVSLLLNNIVANSSSISKMYRTSGNRNETFPMELGEKYLILTVSEHLACAEELRNWKQKLGYNVIIESRLSWDTTSVKNFISSLDDISYLLIIGNHQQIPALNQSDAPWPEGYVSDFPYGCTNNGYLQDIYVGRLLADNVLESNTLVEKIIDYEMNPVMDTTFYKTAVHATFLENNTNAKTAEDISCHVINNGYNVKRVYMATPSNVSLDYWPRTDLYEDTIPFPQNLKYPDFIWNGSGSDVISQMNQGAFYVLHLGHGEIDQWRLPYLPQSSSFSNGSKQPVFFNFNCLTGSFDNFESQLTSCFAHSITTNQDGGAVAIFAATAKTFFITNRILAMSMVDAFLPDSLFFPHQLFINNTYQSHRPLYKLGEIFAQGHFYINKYLTDNIWQEEVQMPFDVDVCVFTNKTYHLFGDPSMEIYTAKPTPFNDVQITRDLNYLYISLSDTATISLAKNGQNAIGYVYQGKELRIPLDSCTNSSLVINKHNKIPYVINNINVNNYDLVIQNTTFTANTTLQSNKIKVGHHVNPQAVNGNVTVQSGKLTLVGNTVELSPGTEVKIGAGLEIKKP